MSAMKKGTKLTDNPKDYMLRVRLDDDTVDMLDTVCQSTGATRSAIVRRGIKLQYQEQKKREQVVSD